MDLEVKSQEVAFETNLIDDIDAKGHLVVSDIETEKTNEVDVDFDSRKKQMMLSEGFLILRDVKKRRRDLRTGCQAFLRISKTKDGKCSNVGTWSNWVETLSKAGSRSTKNPIEAKAKAGSRYTKNLFDVFKKEWAEATFNLTHETISKSLEEIKYRVGQLNIGKIYWRTVNFRLLDTIDVICSCAKFETYGILCKHILYVLKKRHVETLPDHYILPRWTLDARHKLDNYTIGLEDKHNENEVSSLTLWCVQSNFRKAIEQAKDSSYEIGKLNTILLTFLEEQSTQTKPKYVQTASQDSNVGSSQVNIIPQISIRDPLVHTNTKGRPKSATRIKSSLEAPKKKSCSYCKGLGHYISGCLKKKMTAASRIVDKY
ncbi:hypothetical protein E3N88_01577 [Mikania micrantha]|uniref:SWIM-type domain-containing protein n=1 Tax=Mikania micrantha TaxID=192012 RepID=A0A5N6Q392_9ASTR|nr:hypothetical protein E3N88_01577 [Mikania micrantha]